MTRNTLGYDGLRRHGVRVRHETLTDLAAAHELAGKPLAGVTTADLPSGGELRLVFAGAPSVTLRHVDGRSHVVVG